MPRCFDRREILKLGASALALGLSARGQNSAASKRILFRYKTDPDALARLVPPGLQAGAEPFVDVEIEWFEPARPDLLAPKSFGIARFSVAVRHGEREGRLPVGVYTSNDRERLVARESQGLPAKDAAIEATLSADAVKVSVARRGETLFALAATPGETGAAPPLPPLLAPVFSLDPNWNRGVVRAQGAELWEIESATPATARSAALVSAELPYASPGDPLAELPIVEPAGVWLLDAAPPSKPKKIADLDGAALAAWAPLRFDRPVEQERFWMPAGWREKSTAYRLSDEEVARYKKRREIILDPIEVVEIDAMISLEAHQALVPPICRVAGRPMIKLLGLRVGASAFSPVAFSEVWLFAFTITANRLAWYAVSHIVGEGGDVTFGRDVFGYPSKSGEADIVVTPVDFSLALKRMGREIAFADGAFHGFSTGTSLAQLPMASLRAKPGGGGAELFYQMWTFQGRRNRVDPTGFQMGFPDGAAPGLELKPDPWYELGAAQPVSISVMENGVMQRAPAELVAELPDFAPFYRERCDGVLPWEARPAQLKQPSLLAGLAAGASS